MRVVATAGHVDHGKSTLVRALTGMEPDRWAEERRRGMTIDLGFAWTTLDDGEELAFVDVPGHERFLANMLAGIGPAPAVLFVVAADEGWRRQSEEHLAAVDALGIDTGLLVVTRCDLADPREAIDAARERIAASSLAEVEAVAVSALTGDGLPELRGALARMVSRLPTPSPDGPVRLWVDRAFTVSGSGTVVTATLGAGTVGVGDQLELRDRRVAVRAIQTLGRSTDGVPAVARVALNLRGVPRSGVGRGDALLTPGTWPWSSTLDVAVRPEAADVTGDAMFHLGSAATPVRARLLGPGFARLTLAAPLPLRPGDRGVLRNPGRHEIVAGVTVLDVDPPELRRRGAGRSRAEELAGWLGASGADPARSDPARSAAAVAAEIARRSAIRHEHLRLLGRTGPIPDGVRSVGGWLIDDAAWQRWVTDAPAAVRRYLDGHPLETGMPAGVLQRQLALPDPALLEPVVVGGGLRTESGRVAPPARSSSLGAAEAGVAALEARLQAAPFDAPEQPELQALRLGHRELAAAARAGRIVRLPGDIVLLPTAVPIATERLAALPQPFTTSQARAALGTTRRVAIPLLEHLDMTGITERIDAGTRAVIADR